MTKQEINIITKIIKELSLFFMMHGYHSFSMKMYREDTNTIIVFKIKNLKTELIDKLTEKINRERELEIETYGFELVGDSDVKNELEVVGLLIDYVEIDTVEEETILSFVRKDYYSSK